MSFAKYIETMKELGWSDEDLKDDYVLYETSTEHGISLPWQLFIQPRVRIDTISYPM
ncbi:MAG: hypothetical protein IIZ47_00565 [Erysipelotrichaceae bacterium]|nr:hypothetical protein [Erysipelotrichaceae bacterium]